MIKVKKNTIDYQTCSDSELRNFINQYLNQLKKMESKKQQS